MSRRKVPEKRRSNKRRRNTKRAERAKLGQQKSEVQMKLSLKEIDKIGQPKPKRSLRTPENTGIHSYNQMRHATSASTNFIRFVKDKFNINQLQNLKQEHYVAYINDMQHRKLSDGHIRNVETSLQQLEKGFNFRQKRLEFSPVKFTPQKRMVAYTNPAPRDRSYTNEEYKEILKNATAGAKGGIQLMRKIGLRVREAANVRVEHFIKIGNRYVLKIGSKQGGGITKGGRFRDIPVPKHFNQRLEQMLHGKKGTETLINLTHESLRSAVRDACKKAEIKQDGRGTHGFRHSYARERGEHLMADKERVMMDRVLKNISEGKTADYGIFTEIDRGIFTKMKDKMDQIHSELGHGKNRYHLAMVYLRSDGDGNS